MMPGRPLPTNCLPSILAHYGYETHWFHGYEKNFYNRDEFFPSIGFQKLDDQSVINADTVCFESSQDLIFPDIEFELSKSDQTDQKILIDVTQHLLRNAYLPQAELLQ